MMIHALGEEYKGKKLLFRYVTDAYFDVRLEEMADGWKFVLQEKPFPVPTEKQFTDTLLQNWLEEPRLFGAVEGGQVVGYLEISHEKWHSRLRISNLFVKEEFRRMKVGEFLFQKAEKEARRLQARAIVLETQSCNAPAIRFYRQMGMTLVGLDTTAYSNEDLEKREVRLEFGKVVEAEIP